MAQDRMWEDQSSSISEIPDPQSTGSGYNAVIIPYSSNETPCMIRTEKVAGGSNAPTYLVTVPVYLGAVLSFMGNFVCAGYNAIA
jgi:hypothetical protein